mgnify:FL=1|jgi:cell shape-determining protein MreC
MKNICTFFLLLFVLNSFSQTQNINVTVKEEKDPMEGLDEAIAAKKAEYREVQKEVGIKYLGDGEYKMTKVYDNGWSKRKKIQLKLDKDLEVFSNNKNADSYRVINKELARNGLDWWRADVIFNLLDNKGDVILNKDDAKADKKDAKQELLDLKDLLDMGIITQEEFNKKAKVLKKILLAD